MISDKFGTGKFLGHESEVTFKMANPIWQLRNEHCRPDFQKINKILSNWFQWGFWGR